MILHYCSGYDEMSQLSCESVISGLKENPSQLICTATGNSPLGMYKKMVDNYRADPHIFKELRIIKLDEWGGISAKNSNSCESFLVQHILQPLHISDDRYISFKSNPDSPKKECERIQDEIQKKGPIDVCILGMGLNGHIGFNEPANKLQSDCHVAQLSKDSLGHQMTLTMENKPAYGLTMGMVNILQSKKIILLLTGKNKKDIINKLLSKQITTHLPASLLWLHHDVECYIDGNSV